MTLIFAIFSLYALFKRYEDIKLSTYQAISMSLLLVGTSCIHVKEQIAIILMLHISIIDIKENIIPNILSVLIFILGTNYFSVDMTIETIISLIFLFILALTSIVSGSIGFGDIKLLIALYIFLGSNRFIGLLFYLCLFVFLASISLFFTRNASKKQTCGMAPAIFVAFILVIFGG